MKLISLNKIADDMVLARNVYAREGNVLLAKDAPLKHHYAKRLLDWGVNSVFVQDSQGDLLEIDAELCQQAKDDVLKLMNDFLADLNSQQLPESAKQMMDDLIKQLLADGNILQNLVEIKAVNDNIFRHCVTVSVLSMIIGIFSGYSANRLKELATGAILIDVGKTMLTNELLSDPNLLPAKENLELQKHSKHGFDKLKQIKGNYESAAQIVLQHHEKYDGSGFPTGLKGEQINELARIVAIADAYDTLINEGMNGRKLMPHEVIEYIRDYSGSHFDPELSRVFLQNITPFLIGSNVLLNTGEKAKVITINKDLLARPVIRVMMDKDGNKLTQPIVKDLATDLTLFIVSALKDEDL